MRWSVRGVARHLVEGVIIGAANVIPGVSGGTMALIFGIYEDLVSSLSDGFRGVLGLAGGKIDVFSERMRTVRWELIVPLLAGALIVLLLGGRIVPYLLDRFPAESRGLFFGLIVGSIVVPAMHIREFRPSQLVVGLLAAVAAFVLSGLPGASPGDPSLLGVFLVAAVAISAMILPGISGAHLLLVLGMYRPTFEAIDEGNIAYISVFAIGALAGLGAFARLLNWLLERHHDAAMAALIGLMAGSLRALWPWTGIEVAEPVTVISLMLLGAVAALAMVAVSRRLARPEPLALDGET